MTDFYALRSVEFWDLLLRVGLALLFGLLIGLDRDTKNKPIDFRAFMIVAATTCIVAVLGQELYLKYTTEAANFASLDLGKIISGVLTGIGFLGAGAILKVEEDRVVGTATGASIWASGGIGLALGFGFYELAALGFVAVALVLVGGGFVMSRFMGQQDKE